jgi:hypothetical protein
MKFILETLRIILTIIFIPILAWSYFGVVLIFFIMEGTFVTPSELGIFDIYRYDPNRFKIG